MFSYRKLKKQYKALKAEVVQLRLDKARLQQEKYFLQLELNEVQKERFATINVSSLTTTKDQLDKLAQSLNKEVSRVH